MDPGSYFLELRESLGTANAQKPPHKNACWVLVTASWHSDTPYFSIRVTLYCPTTPALPTSVFPCLCVCQCVCQCVCVFVRCVCVCVCVCVFLNQLQSFL